MDSLILSSLFRSNFFIMDINFSPSSSLTFLPSSSPSSLNFFISSHLSIAFFNKIRLAISWFSREISFVRNSSFLTSKAPPARRILSSSSFIFKNSSFPSSTWRISGFVLAFLIFPSSEEGFLSFIPSSLYLSK